MLAERITDEMAGWAGVVGVILTAVTITASIILFDGFDWAVHDLSTLAHVDREIAADSRFVYSGGIIVVGLFGLAFAAGLFRLEQRRLWQAGAVLYAISHLTLIWQGIFPAGVPQHNWLSIFPFFTGALLLLGLDQVRTTETRLFGAIVLSNLLVGLLGAGLLFQTDIEGSAIFQMFGVSVFSIATLLFAARLLDAVETNQQATTGGGL